MTDDDAQRINGAINAACSALHAKIQDDLAVIRNTLLSVQVLVNALARRHPDPKRLAAEFDLDCEHAIADVLTRGYPEWIVARYEKDFEDLRAYLTGLAKAADQGTGGES